MGRPDEFAHLVRLLIENDYMNAEVVRFDGGIRFQPKLCPATSGCYLTCGNVLSAPFRLDPRCRYQRRLHQGRPGKGHAGHVGSVRVHIRCRPGHVRWRG
jgi:hypothetical protein